MAELPNHFFLKHQSLCPVCRQPFVAWAVNPRLYGVDTREDDRHVLSYVWSQGIQTEIRPDHHELWHCPHCAYTALFQDFQCGSQTAFQRHRWAAWRQLPPGLLLGIRPWLGHLRGEPPWDDGQVLLLLALARMALLQVPEENRDGMELGRVHLRLAWLYREKPVLCVSEGAAEEEEPVRADLLQAALEMGEACETVQRVWLRLKMLVEQNPGTMGPTNWKAPMLSLDQKINGLCLSQKVFGQVLARRGRAVLTGGQDGAETLMGSGGRGLVANLQETWNDLPGTEAEATLAAVDDFERGILRGEGDLGAGAQVNLMVTSIRLLLRTGQIRRGFRYITDVSRVGFSEKQTLTRKIRDLERQGGGLEQRKPLVRQLNQINAALGQFSDLRDLLTQSFLEQEGEELRQALEGVNGREAQLALLEGQGVPDLLYRDLEARGWLSPE